MKQSSVNYSKKAIKPSKLIEATYDWTNILKKGIGQVDVIILDLSKALDVLHHRLLMKLYIYGITGKTCR